MPGTDLRELLAQPELDLNKANLQKDCFVCIVTQASSFRQSMEAKHYMADEKTTMPRLQLT